MSLVKEMATAFLEKDMRFPEVFDDYDQYHESVQTGKIQRYNLIQDWIVPGSSVLDVGVGDGVIAEHLAKTKGAYVTGFDISNRACEKARRRGIAVEVKDVNNGLNISQTFDYILLMEIIEHTVYPQKILKEAVAHTTKGVIVTIPNSAYLRWRIHLLRGYAPRQSFTHLHQWSIKDFELFCKLLDIKILGFKTSLPARLLPSRNILAKQQCWLLAPETNYV